MSAVRSRWSRFSSLLPLTITLALLAMAVGRVISTYPILSQAADEPATVGAGIEWLDRGTYQVDPLHPPLARVASALGPFLEGLRFPPDESLEKTSDGNPFRAGDKILNEKGTYWRNLALARLGMIPFFALGVWLVFVWGREVGGNGVAVASVLLFTTLPPILAFTGFAYTDLPVGVLIATAAFAFRKWLAEPSLARAIVCGLVTGLAVVSKFTALLFVPACFLAIVCCWLWLGSKGAFPLRSGARQAVLFAVAVLIVVWGGYRFSVGSLHSVFRRPEHDIQVLHVPGSVKNVLSKAVDVPLPAPALFKGLSWNLEFNVEGRPSYLLGNIRRNGWWYFFLVVIAVKTPLPFLFFAIFGGVSSLLLARKERNWSLAAPFACALAILLLSMPVKVNYGVRHILCVYPFLSVAAGWGVVKLWQKPIAGSELAPRIVTVALLAWLVVSSAMIHPDYVAYFNELAARKPDRVLLWGCDYDCGQDIGRLAKLSKERNIDHLSLAVFGNNDFSKMGLPPFQKLAPGEPTTGWIAVSIRELDTGDLFVGGEQRDAFRWIAQCQPVGRAGKTIYLYYLPCGSTKNLRAGK